MLELFFLLYPSLRGYRSDTIAFADVITKSVFRVGLRRLHVDRLARAALRGAALEAKASQLGALCHEARARPQSDAAQPTAGRRRRLLSFC